MDPSAFLTQIHQMPDVLDRLAARWERGEAGQPDGIPGLAEASRVLDTSSPVWIAGMGSSAYAAQTVARHAQGQGLCVVAVAASARELPPPGTGTLVAVSATGESQEVLRAVEPWAGSGRLIAVTDVPSSSLAQRADAVVQLCGGDNPSGTSVTNFRTTLLVLTALLRHLGFSTPVPFDVAAREAAGRLRDLLDSHGQWVDPLTDLLRGPDGCRILAPAERESSARQGALMIREIPRRPAEGSETGEWSHVDLYLARTQDYRALIFTGSPWDAHAVEWLRRRRARFAAVGSPLEGAETVLPLSAGDGSWLVGALTETVVPELLAASWWQEDPEFQWADPPPAVARDGL